MRHVAESLIVQTAPGNVIKFIPNFTPPLPGVDTWTYIRYQLREMGLLDLQPSTAGPASAENSQGASTVTDAWQAGSPVELCWSPVSLRGRSSAHGHVWRHDLPAAGCRRPAGYPLSEYVGQRHPGQHTVVSLRKR